jgi:hypothetical protein
MSGRSYLRQTESSICEAQVACEGNYIRLQRQAKGLKTCGMCEKAIEKRNKVIPPRGINYKENADE